MRDGNELGTRCRRPLGLLALGLTLLIAMMSPGVAGAAGAGAAGGDDRGPSVVVANRGSGDISVIDVDTFATETVALPGAAEPMYVSHDRRHGRVLVGDRASGSVVAFDDNSYEVVGSVPVGAGVFHQWLDVSAERLWVVGDVDNTVTVVDTASLAVVATIDLPADLVAAGGRPHDVFVDGRHAFVSLVGLGDGGVVVRYATSTFAETGRIDTGGDPHLFIDGGRLFVASQDGSTVSSYQTSTLAPRGSIEVPNAHGIWVTERGEVFATNIAGGGTDAIWALNRRLTGVVDTTDTSVPTPHNITVDSQRQLWVTHSGGTANQVTVIDLEQGGFGSSLVLSVGTNPFGLAFVR